MKRLLPILVYAVLPNVVSAAATDIASVPIEKSAVVPPNIILGLDDSGSMDWEVLFNTSDGTIYWDSNSNSFVNNSNQFYQGSESGRDFTEYGYLFPNGTNSDGMLTTMARPLPPLPAFAFARCSDYNPVYYNPMVTYKPWSEAYYGGSTRTFADSTPQSARSHPIFPTSGTAVTFDLDSTRNSNNTGDTFFMAEGMVIPGATVSGIQYYTNRWRTATTNITVPNGGYQVAVPYVPATYYVIDSTCTTGSNCAVAPDGKRLRKYVIQSGNTFPSGRTYAAELQNFANWFTYYRKRKLHVASAMSSVLPTLQGLRGGIVQFNNRSSPTMYDFNSPTASANEKVLLGTIYQNPSSGGTPTRQAMQFIGNQFMTNPSIIQYGCQQNSEMILTDGYANGTSVSVPSYSQSTYGSTRPYSTTYSGTLADLALAYYTLNLRPDLPLGLVTNGSNSQINFDTNPNLHLNTYAITLATTGTIFNTGVPAALNPFSTFPTWPNPGFNSDPTAVDDLWHATINGRGLIFNTPDITSLTSQILNVFTTVLIQSGAGSAVGVVQSYISSVNNIALLTSYVGTTGNLISVPINSSTGDIVMSTPFWSAQTLLDAMDPTRRVIATYNGSAGVPFEWANLSLMQQLSLNTTLTSLDGQSVLAWLRGDRSKEGNPYRARSHILGDVVYAQPVVVNGAMGSYADTGYATFANSIASRSPVIYQGVNDGMLHAFDKATGQERWAYVPNAVFPNLVNLSKTSYTHQFFVDATPTVGDVYVGGTWKTILVGGLRAGGKGFYALDITNPDSITNEAGLASKVLWEFPNASTPASVVNDLGLSFGKPVIVKTNAVGWVVLVTSGYNNTTSGGKGHLFVLNPANGAVIADLNTGAGSSSTPSGLAQLAAYAPNANSNPLATFVYGGDLLGNVWRFDISDVSVSNWNVKLLATLVDSTGTPQPITTEPEIGLYNNQRFIYVGTGQLLGTSDIASTQTQSMYALIDNLSTNPTITSLRTSLVQRTVVGSTIQGATFNSTTNRGWYIDFPAGGERSTTTPVLAFGTLIFNTNAPSASACSSQTYQYAVNLSTGLTLSSNAFAVGVTPWARRLIGNTLSSNPTIIVLGSGVVIALTHKSDNTIDNSIVPQTGASSVSKIAWKEILTQ